MEKIEKSRKKVKLKLFKSSKDRNLRSETYQKKIEEISLQYDSKKHENHYLTHVSQK